MKEIGIPELSMEQIENICQIAEENVRNFILSKVPLRRISSFDVIIEIEGAKPIAVNVEINLELSPLMKGYDVEELVKEASRQAFLSVEKYLKGLTCKSTT